MALLPLRTLLDHAAENDYGVAAFNVNNMEQIQAIMEAAEETDSPEESSAMMPLIVNPVEPSPPFTASRLDSSKGSVAASSSRGSSISRPLNRDRGSPIGREASRLRFC